MSVSGINSKGIIRWSRSTVLGKLTHDDVSRLLVCGSFPSPCYQSLVSQLRAREEPPQPLQLGQESTLTNRAMIDGPPLPCSPPPLPCFRKLLGEEGWPEGFISKVPLYLSVFSTGHKRFFRLPLVVIKKASFAVVQRLGKGMPTVAGAETWAFKNTMLAVQVRFVVAIVGSFFAGRSVRIRRLEHEHCCLHCRL